jgi:hypothetical protein
VKNVRKEGRKATEDKNSKEVKTSAQFVNDNGGFSFPSFSNKENFL